MNRLLNTITEAIERVTRNNDEANRRNTARMDQLERLLIDQINEANEQRAEQPQQQPRNLNNQENQNELQQIVQENVQAIQRPVQANRENASRQNINANRGNIDQQNQNRGNDQRLANALPVDDHNMDNTEDEYRAFKIIQRRIDTISIINQMIGLENSWSAIEYKLENLRQAYGESMLDFVQRTKALYCEYLTLYGQTPDETVKAKTSRDVSRKFIMGITNKRVKDALKNYGSDPGWDTQAGTQPNGHNKSSLGAGNATGLG